MNLNFVSEVWDALRSHIDLNERKDAADTLVNLLIENNFEADEIKDSFRGDKEIANALKYYANQHESDFEEDIEEDLQDFDDEW